MAVVTSKPAQDGVVIGEGVMGVVVVLAVASGCSGEWIVIAECVTTSSGVECRRRMLMRGR